MKTISVDAELVNSDWTKQSWDLPPYKSDAFFHIYHPRDLAAFRETPVYQHAVEQGLIFDDEWVDHHATPA